MAGGGKFFSMPGGQRRSGGRGGMDEEQQDELAELAERLDRAQLPPEAQKVGPAKTTLPVVMLKAVASECPGHVLRAPLKNSSSSKPHVIHRV